MGVGVYIHGGNRIVGVKFAWVLLFAFKNNCDCQSFVNGFGNGGKMSKLGLY
jgi:hypothetical protein